MSEDDYLKIATRVLFTEQDFWIRRNSTIGSSSTLTMRFSGCRPGRTVRDDVNPNLRLSMIYRENSYGLGDQLTGIQSRKSITAIPLPRTVHSYTNIMVDAASTDSIEGNACFTVHTLRSARWQKAIPTSDALNFGCAVLESLADRIQKISL